MRIAFVSLMSGFPWGGSEDLWFRTAKLALTGGNTVFTLTKKWPKTPGKIAELKSLGAQTEFYYQPAYTIGDRIQIKLKLKKYQPYLVPEVIADLYLISTGTTFDFVYLQQITNKIISSGKPYILISQHNFESGGLITGPQQLYGINVIQNALKFLFCVGA